MTARPTNNSNSPTTWGVGLLGALLLWAALPPLHLAHAAWVAPVPWFWLARLPQLPGRRPYAALWCAGFAFWMATNHWLRLPHWATSFGWLALAAYLACFTPLMVGLMRVAARRRISILVAGPALWVAADEARAYLLTGFSMSSLCHSQYRLPVMIQFADVCGEFGVTFAMAVVAAAVARALPTVRGGRWSLQALVLVPTVIAALVAYGAWRMQPSDDGNFRTLNIALIQGSIESEVKHDPTKLPLIYDNYLALSRRAVASNPGAELIVWPETMFPYPHWQVADDARPPPDEDWTPEQLRRRAAEFHNLIAQTAAGLGRPMLLGIAAAEFGPGVVRGYNAALLVDAVGRPQGRYDKQHRVLFGEYIPLADWFPWLYRMTPLTGGIEAGRRAEAFTLGTIRLAPNICYETALARVIRRQVAELCDRRETPDVLVNLTNDSWFRGSSELDLHLACGVFRAVEMRKPLVIAANTGRSASIDDRGRILDVGPRRAEGIIVAEVQAKPHHPTAYLRFGDWLPQFCLTVSVILAVIGVYDRRKQVENDPDAPNSRN